MAVQRPTDSLSELMGSPELSSRQEIWLWLYLATRQNAPFHANDFKGHDMRERMAEFIQASGMNKESIRAEMSRTLLPDECLQWITTNCRQLDWLAMRGGVAYGNPPPRLQGREFVVASIEIADSDISVKKSELQSLESAWAMHKQQDRIFKWFQDGKTGSQRCSLAWEWLCKNRPLSTFNKMPFGDYNGLLAFFDQPALGDADKKLCVMEVKKRWSQQRYREKLVGKKQYNFVLSDKAIQHLDNLAVTHGLKRNQILEILIQMEAAGGSYIAEKLKVLKGLE